MALKLDDVCGDYITISRMETTTFKVEDNGEVISDGYKVVPCVKSEAMVFYKKNPEHLINKGFQGIKNSGRET